MAAIGSLARIVVAGTWIAGCAHGLEPDDPGGRATPEAASKLGPSAETPAVWRSCAPHDWRSGRSIEDLPTRHYPPLPASSDVHVATLPDGRVIIGRGGAIYDPHLDRYETLMVPDEVWSEGSVTAIGEGHEVLFAGGGVDGAASRDAWLLDVEQRSFRRVAQMLAPRMFHRAVALAGGRVLVVGGSHEGRSPEPYAEVYDPDRDAWLPIDAPRFMHGDDTWSSVVSIAGGRFMFAGACSAVTYDPASGAWTTLRLPRARAMRGLATLQDGRVLTYRSGACPSAPNAGDEATSDLFDPATETWTPLDATPNVGAQPMLVPLGCGQVMALGRGEGASPRAAIFDPERARWRSVEAPAFLAKATNAATLPDGSVITLGSLETQIASRAYPIVFAPVR